MLLTCAPLFAKAIKETNELVNEQQIPIPEAHKAVRLVDYLLRLATLRTKLIRNIDEYTKVLWFSSIPREQGCFTKAWGRMRSMNLTYGWKFKTGESRNYPLCPCNVKTGLNVPSLRNKDDLPELLTEIIRQIPNPDWREGSDQPETIPHTERIEDHPEVQQAWDRYR